jgi:hypothetical protein
MACCGSDAAAVHCTWSPVGSCYAAATVQGSGAVKAQWAEAAASMSLPMARAVYVDILSHSLDVWLFAWVLASYAVGRACCGRRSQLDAHDYGMVLGGWLFIFTGLKILWPAASLQSQD